MRLPNEVIDYIFEFYNPFTEYNSKYVLRELKIRFIQDILIKTKNAYIDRYGINAFEGIHPCSLGKMPHDKANKSLIKNIDNINQCIDDIPKIFKKLKSAYKIGSYSGKHAIERHRSYLYGNKDNYISNGEFIIAMILAGYEYKIYMDCGRPYVNCDFKAKEYKGNHPL